MPKAPTSAARAAVLVIQLLIVAAVFCGDLSGQVQFPRPRKDKDKNPQKNLTGQVIDKSGKGLAEAVVYLKDKKSLQIRTHISDDTGAYRFSGLDPDSDYEVHAEFQGASSPKRTVSSFDDRRDVYLVLEIQSSQ